MTSPSWQDWIDAPLPKGRCVKCRNVDGRFITATGRFCGVCLDGIDLDVTARKHGFGRSIWASRPMPRLPHALDCPSHTGRGPAGCTCNATAPALANRQPERQAPAPNRQANRQGSLGLALPPPPKVVGKKR